MNFIDKAEIYIQAGKGGDGHVSFRRDRHNSRGGPDGGDGGNGGNIVLKASNNSNSLAYFRFSKQLNGQPGQSGSSNDKHGKSGKDLIVLVPVGTEAKNEQGVLIADLTTDQQMAVVAKGGKGGFGNAHFVSSRRQGPSFGEKGEPGEELKLTLELKMLADIGLVGLPNAGKSTLLASISHAHPKIADYPFTTLNPSVGVVDVDNEHSLLFADIPGLIEGAAEGKGLGHDFLRHIERTAVIVYVIDGYSKDIKEDYLILKKELASYNKQLAKRPQVIALNKTEGLDNEIVGDLLSTLKQVVKPKTTPIVPISAKSGKNLKELLFKALAAKQKVDANKSRNQSNEVFEYILGDDDRTWWVSKKQDNEYLVTGQQIERFALRTDFNNDQAVARFLDILKKRGIIHELIRQGLEPGDSIIIANKARIIY